MTSILAEMIIYSYRTGETFALQDYLEENQELELLEELTKNGKLSEFYNELALDFLGINEKKNVKLRYRIMENVPKETQMEIVHRAAYAVLEGKFKTVHEALTKWKC